MACDDGVVLLGFQDLAKQNLGYLFFALKTLAFIATYTLGFVH